MTLYFPCDVLHLNLVLTQTFSSSFSTVWGFSPWRCDSLWDFVCACRLWRSHFECTFCSWSSNLCLVLLVLVSVPRSLSLVNGTLHFLEILVPSLIDFLPMLTSSHPPPSLLRSKWFLHVCSCENCFVRLALSDSYSLMITLLSPGSAQSKMFRILVHLVWLLVVRRVARTLQVLSLLATLLAHVHSMRLALRLHAAFSSTLVTACGNPDTLKSKSVSSCCVNKPTDCPLFTSLSVLYIGTFAAKQDTLVDFLSKPTEWLLTLHKSPCAYDWVWGLWLGLVGVFTNSFLNKFGGIRSNAYAFS